MKVALHVAEMDALDWADAIVCIRNTPNSSVVFAFRMVTAYTVFRLLQVLRFPPYTSFSFLKSLVLLLHEANRWFTVAQESH